MKVINVKRYLAALSAAAISTGAVNMPANAEALYAPLPLNSLTDAVLYIEDNPDLMDFDGNGKFDTFDSYALFTYVNEPESLPDGYAARCAAYGDFNKDGAVDTTDSDLLKEICFLKFSQDNYDDLYNNTQYLVPPNTDIKKHVYRTLSPDTPDDIREVLSNEYIDDSYTYGSEANRNSFMDYLFSNYEDSAFSEEHVFDKYNDAYYKRFAADVERINYSFDVNEDGIVDMKDLYDIYIYDLCSADDDKPITKDFYLGRLNFVEEVIDGVLTIHSDRVHTLRTYLPFPEEYKQDLWEKCEPMYDYVNSFLRYSENGNIPFNTTTVFELIARYIMSNTDLDVINMSDLYFVQYHGIVEIFDYSISQLFAEKVNWYLRNFFSKAGDPNFNSYNIIYVPDKCYELVKDNPYMHDNDVVRAIDQKAREDFESGLTRELYDINKDGKIDRFDTYVLDLYYSDLFNQVTVENSIIPADQWNYMDNELDLDNDGIASTYIDKFIFEYVVGSSYNLPQYKRDIYYLQLLEDKGLVDLSDIRPYIEKLCKDKEAGDVDLDGKVTAVDSCEVLKYYSQVSVDADISPVTAAKMEYMADYNNDGTVDSIDASAILTVYTENSVQN